MVKRYDKTYSSEIGPQAGAFPVGSAPFTTGVAGGRSLVRRERMRLRTTVSLHGLDAAVQLFERFPDRLFQKMAKAVTAATIIVHQEIIRAIRARHRVRTGRWIGSWQLRVLAQRRGGPGQIAGGTIIGLVSSKHPASRLHAEQGEKRIVSSGKPMPIPISDEAKRVGHPKRMEGRLTTYKDPVTGEVFKIERIGDRTIFHYVLKNSFTVQASGYLQAALEAASPRIFKEVGDGIHIAVTGV